MVISSSGGPGDITYIFTPTPGVEILGDELEEGWTGSHLPYYLLTFALIPATVPRAQVDIVLNLLCSPDVLPLRHHHLMFGNKISPSLCEFCAAHEISSAVGLAHTNSVPVS